MEILCVEHPWLRGDVVSPPALVERPDEPLRSLTRTHFVEQASGAYQVAVPMFATWIRDQKGT